MIFDYRDGRGRDGPAQTLQGFRGKLQSDGYAVYGQLKLDGVLHFACMAHVRRKFHEAAEVDPKDAVLAEILRDIGQLYAIEKRAREEQLTGEQRTLLRQTEGQPILKRLKEVIFAKCQQVLPKSLAGRACEYVSDTPGGVLTRCLGGPGWAKMSESFCYDISDFSDSLLTLRL